MPITLKRLQIAQNRPYAKRCARVREF